MKNAKKLSAFLLILAIIFLSSFIYVHAEENQVSDSLTKLRSASGDILDIVSLQTGSQFASVKDKKLKLDTTVINTYKKMLAPLKFLSETLGAKFEWSPKTKLITLSKNDILVVYQLNSTTAYLNGKKTILDIAPQLSGNVVMLPVKYTVESMGVEYEWNDKLKISYIKKRIKTVVFTDIYLEIAIREQIKKPKGVILASDVSNIDSLTISDKRITNLNGLQNFTNLIKLKVSNTNISDLTPISSLKNLQYLFITESRVKDITPLKNLLNLITLDLSDNQIMDASIIQALTKLTSINLWDCNSVTDILRINEAAGNIISEIIKPDMTDYQKELNIHDYLVTHMKYDSDNYNKLTLSEDDHNASGFFFNKTGVCDAYAKAFKILLNRCGIEAYVVYGNSIGQKDPGYEDFGHAWNIVKIDINYYHVDPTFDDPINAESVEKDVLIHKYFNLSDRQMALSHTWGRSDYPACSIDNPGYDQYIKSNREIVSTPDYTYGVFNNKLYRFKPDGSEIKRLTEDNVKYISLAGDYLFYMNIDDSNRIYRIKTDGSDKSKIIDEPALFPYVSGDYIYFITKSKGVFSRAKLDGTEKSSLGLSTYTSYFDILDGFIYCSGFEWSGGSKLYRANTDLSGKTAIIDEPIPGFELSDNNRSLSVYYVNYEVYSKDYIFYISKNNGNKIFRIKKDGTEKTELNSSDSSELEYYEGYIYYKNNQDNRYYRVKADGSGKEELIG